MKRYKGMRINPEQETGSDVKVVVQYFEGDTFDVENMKRAERLAHHVEHSPTGFCWGYGGSGPADLALSILWDFLGKRPVTAMYMEFKWHFVATWGAEWEITSKEIEDWIVEWGVKQCKKQD